MPLSSESTIPHLTGYAQSGGLRIHFRRFASSATLRLPGPAGDPLLIIHGLSYFSYDWIGIATALAATRDVVAIDLRGFGDSDASTSGLYGLRDHAADVIAVLDHLGWAEAVLMGHSMGGRIALCTAAWFPARVSAIACIDFAPDVAAEGRRNVAQRIGNQPDVFEGLDHVLRYHGHDPAQVAEGASLRRRFAAFTRAVDGGLALKRDLHFRDTFRTTLTTGKAPPVNVDLWALLTGLAIPMLFVRGEASDMFAAETLSKLVNANPRVSVREIAGSHDLAGDNPEGVVATLREFLVPGTASAS